MHKQNELLRFESLFEQEVADLPALTEDYTNKCVVVNYEGRAYPGVVLTDDADDDAVEVRCMHRIENN